MKPIFDYPSFPHSQLYPTQTVDGAVYLAGGERYREALERARRSRQPLLRAIFDSLPTALGGTGGGKKTPIMRKTSSV